MSIILTILLVLVFVFLWFANTYFKLSDSRDSAVRAYNNYLWADENETSSQRVAEARLAYNQSARYFNSVLDKFPSNVIGYVSAERFPRLALEEQPESASNAPIVAMPQQLQPVNIVAAADDQNLAA